MSPVAQSRWREIAWAASSGENTGTVKLPPALPARFRSIVIPARFFPRSGACRGKGRRPLGVDGVLSDLARGRSPHRRSPTLTSSAAARILVRSTSMAGSVLCENRSRSAIAADWRGNDRPGRDEICIEDIAHAQSLTGIMLQERTAATGTPVRGLKQDLRLSGQSLRAC
jgi:hypothetical protein